MSPNSTELAMARLRGALEAELGTPPERCPYPDRPRRAAWVSGYLVHVVSTSSNDFNALPAFPVKPRGDWGVAEIELLVQAWRGPLPIGALAGLLGRSPIAVKCRAVRAGLGARPGRAKANAP